MDKETFPEMMRSPRGKGIALVDSVRCEHCDNMMVFLHSEVIYGIHYGNYYCSKCGHRVSVGVRL